MIKTEPPAGSSTPTTPRGPVKASAGEAASSNGYGPSHSSPRTPITPYTSPASKKTSYSSGPTNPPFSFSPLCGKAFNSPQQPSKPAPLSPPPAPQKWISASSNKKSDIQTGIENLIKHLDTEGRKHARTGDVEEYNKEIVRMGFVDVVAERTVSFLVAPKGTREESVDLDIKKLQESEKKIRDAYEKSYQGSEDVGNTHLQDTLDECEKEINEIAKKYELTPDEIKCLYVQTMPPMANPAPGLNQDSSFAPPEGSERWFDFAPPNFEPLDPPFLGAPPLERNPSDWASFDLQSMYRPGLGPT